MPTQLLVRLEDCLETSFEDGDREYVDGVLEEKNMGEVDHSDVVGRIHYWFFSRQKQLNVYPLVEVRMRVSPTRYRVPDVIVVRGAKPVGPAITEPPLLVIEVLSPDDRPSLVDTKIDEYLRAGTSYVRVIDPQTGSGHIYTAERRIAVDDGKFRIHDPAVDMDFAELLKE